MKPRTCAGAARYEFQVETKHSLFILPKQISKQLH